MEEELTRFRLHFHKTRELRFIGHLDLHRALERTLRRAKLPLDYSKGYNPRLKLNLSTALPLGCSSTAELADFWLLSNLDTEFVLEALQVVAPPGLAFISLEKIDLKEASLQSRVTAVTYEVELPEGIDQEQLDTRIQDLMRSEKLMRSRRAKAYDLRPLIQDLRVQSQPQKPTLLKMVLQAGESTTGRPEEVLLALELEPAEAIIERTQLFLSQ